MAEHPGGPSLTMGTLKSKGPSLTLWSSTAVVLWNDRAVWREGLGSAPEALMTEGREACRSRERWRREPPLEGPREGLFSAARPMSDFCPAESSKIISVCRFKPSQLWSFVARAVGSWLPGYYVLLECSLQERICIPFSLDLQLIAQHLTQIFWTNKQMNSWMDWEIQVASQFILQFPFEVFVFLPWASHVWRIAENAADVLKFLSMGQEGKHWLRKCEKRALFYKERRIMPSQENNQRCQQIIGLGQHLLSIWAFRGVFFRWLILPIQFLSRSHCH